MQQFHLYIDALQQRITKALASVDGTAFTFKDWMRPEGGGGRMALLRDGPVLEKGACHVSKVSGSSNPLTGQPFQAAGLSVILHPSNPNVPTVHMNVRRFEQADGGWWGGGMDLTPMGVRHDADVAQFHAILSARLGDRYEAGRQEADRYFHVPHRGRPRGAGGVFYDHILDTEGLALMQAIGDAFLDAYLPILEARHKTPFMDEERLRQLEERGVYAEFNLLYDRGTKFGLQSGGNIEAILSSLPPLVRW
ncbi:MAG: coproporphyrinogen III oxidase [Thermoplasmatota archaeon]